MITEEQKILWEKRLEELKNDTAFITNLCDLRSSLQQFRSTQDLRIRYGNKTGVKKNGDKQKENTKAKNYLILISEEQKKFNDVTYGRALVEEDRIKDRIVTLLSDNDVYNQYLKNIKGVGPITAAELIVRFRPESVPYVSNMYSYAGIIIGKDKRVRGEKANHNALLKKFLLGVLAPNLIKLSSPYAIHYYTKYLYYMNRCHIQIMQGLMCEEFTRKNEDTGGKLQRLYPSHIDRMAKRYMAQRFVKDFFVGFRKVYRLPIIPFYEEEKLALVHVGNYITDPDIFLYSDQKKLTEYNKMCVEKIKSLRETVNYKKETEGYKKAQKIEKEEEEENESSIIEE